MFNFCLMIARVIFMVEEIYIDNENSTEMVWEVL